MMSRPTLTKRARSGARRLPTTSSSSLPNVAEFLATIRDILPRFTLSWVASIPLIALIVGVWSLAASAQDSPPLTPEVVQGNLNAIWVLVASILVIFMNAGFAMLETGFCRQKNAVNILTKNLIVFALATIAYWAFGFSLMFGANGNGFIGWGGFFLSSNDPATYGLNPFPAGLPIALSFLFQSAFAGTAATIVSGAVAERIKFVDFLIFSLLLIGVAYPISGHWVWGGGMLSDIGFLGGVAFKDFAGSTVVHSVGGWAALMGAAILGPRLGKYQEDGTPSAIPGHNMSIATLGCLILWICWFGFNAGSQLAADEAVPYIAVTTSLAAAAGGIAATITSWAVSGKPDLSMVINGILAGLVAITAGCAGVSYGSAVIIGLIGGVMVVFAVFFFDSIQIDDPVGATSVHLVNGVWGTLAVGLFDMEAGLLTGNGTTQLIAQILGILTIGGFTVALSTIFWLVLKSFLGLRVTAEEEMMGLDIGEHGMEAYAGFVKDTTLNSGSSVSSHGGVGTPFQ
ncbi:ammonium transporter [Geitlerinema sp. PCC 7407]|uniref:ammonium transporter n=1 Tax=Geitlerinema sp. PCC 7407 TaxID=1173025 RepID=UPI00029FEEEE|nr:ammonium transporter [Geitlerinema sp. PCC 7407]AFY67881.1 ammonium transporter [Geitlerinema sp. PCC 7407]